MPGEEVDVREQLGAALGAIPEGAIPRSRRDSDSMANRHLLDRGEHHNHPELDPWQAMCQQQNAGRLGRRRN
jgi:hypothetical protein